MKIAVCSSMKFAKEMIDLKNQLEEFGHNVILPNKTEMYAEGSLTPETNKESAENKIKDNLFKTYFKKIKNSDAILVVNLEKNSVPNYVGGNTFLEMAFAHILDKRIFLLNEIPEMIYFDEMTAMQPFILNGDLTLIK